MWRLEEGDLGTLGVMQASKWLRFRVLFDDTTLAQWLDSIGDIYCINLCSACDEKGLYSSKEELLTHYKHYMNELKRGQVVDHSLFQKKLSLHITKDLSTCYKMSLKNSKLHFAKERAPGIRMVLHNFSWDRAHQTIHSNVYAKHSITWGLEFSYPQIFSGSVCDEVTYVLKSKTLPNNELFMQLKQWIRRESKPTTFCYQNQTVVSTLRIDKKGDNWIHHHKGLEDNELKVKL